MEKPVQQQASQEPKQKTRKGLDIPVPSRKEIQAAFRKIIGP